MEEEKIISQLQNDEMTLPQILNFKLDEGYNLWHLCAKQENADLFNKISQLFTKQQVTEKLNEKNKLGDLPAHLAAWSSNLDVLKTIVKYTDNLDFLDSQKRNVAMICIKSKNKKMIDYTLENTKQINQQDKHKQTLLHYAQHFSDATTYEKIILLGCESKLENMHGKTPQAPITEYGESIIDFVNKNKNSTNISKKRVLIN